MASSGTSICVVCRVRPTSDAELKKRRGINCITCPQDDKTTVILSDRDTGEHQYSYDRVFQPTCCQEDLFNFLGPPIIDAVMQGFNATIFAYGQTGAGKTYTMSGETTAGPTAGIIPRVSRGIFTFVKEADATREFEISASCVEIYLEKVRDLLDRSKKNLQIRENKRRGVFLHNVTEKYVTDTAQLLKIIELSRVQMTIRLASEYF